MVYRRQQRQRRSADCRRRQPFRTASVGAGLYPQRRYAGYVNWNGLVEIDEALAPGDQWTTFVGEGKRVSLMPVSAGRFYFSLMCRFRRVWRRIVTPCALTSAATLPAGRRRCRS